MRSAKSFSFAFSLALLLALASLGCKSRAPQQAPGGNLASAADLGGGGDLAGDVGDLGAAGGDLATGHTKTTLRVHYPAGGHALALRGSGGGLNWQKGAALAGGADDTYAYTFVDLPNPIEVKPLLDDATWSRGPNYHIAPGAAADLYPHFTITSGAVVDLIPTFHSTALNNDRSIYVYLPPSYSENTRARFPVLYMHDGQNLFDAARAFGGNTWKVPETLDAAAEDGSIREVIVVGVDNTSQRMYEYTPTTDPNYPQGGGGDLYVELLVDELKPRIDSMLRTMPDREDTAILGSSLGGLISAYASVKRPDVYAIAGAMSPSTWWNNDYIIGAVKGMPKTARPARVYVDSGDSGPSNDDVTDTNLLADAYVGLGYTPNLDFLHVVEAGGQHSEVYWAGRLPAALRFLLGPRLP